METETRCWLAIHFLQTINSRMGAGSEWNLDDLSQEEVVVYNAALKLLGEQFKL